MKFAGVLFFALVLSLPAMSLAEDVPNLAPDEMMVRADTAADSGYTAVKRTNWFAFPEGFSPRIWGVAVGGGLHIFSAGVDIIFGTAGILYESSRPDSVRGFWNPPHMLMWMNRLRMVYDGRQYGILFQPNIRYLFDMCMFSFVVGPEIGWETETGFEYGASLRIGGVPSLLLANYEIGYLVNSRKFYFTISFCFSPYLFGAAMSI